MRGIRWAVVATSVVAVFGVSGCGSALNLRPAGASASTDGGSSPAGTAGSSAVSAASPSAADPVVVTTSGSMVCVKHKNGGGQACVSSHGTAVVDGVVIVDGKVVATASGSGSSGVVVNGGSVVVGGSDAVTVPTSGKVTLSGAIRWSGTATGTCTRTGSVREATVDVHSGRLTVHAVGEGVLTLGLEGGSGEYGASYVGDSGVVTMDDGHLSVHQARLGGSAGTVVLDAALNC
ncbi:MAG TPA: hypothetical protein VHN80_19000 [Kineosporiaceae bacterium]|nr:hypothetical protein [Kineosporiaceae bacterium]